MEINKLDSVAVVGLGLLGGSLSALSNEWTNDPDLPVKRRARSLARVLGDLVQPREPKTGERR